MTDTNETPESENTVLDYIPDEVPPRSMTSIGVNWPAEDFAGLNWETATVKVHGGENFPLAEVKLEGIPLTEVTLYGDLDWEEMDMVVVVNFINGAEVVLLVTVVEDEGEQVLEGVAIPGQTFARGAMPPQWRINFAQTVRHYINLGVLETVGPNMNVVLSWADEEY